MPYTSTDQPLPKGKLLKFYECGICGAHHPLTWDGDCREDAARFAPDELDAKFGPLGWEEVPMPTWEDEGTEGQDRESYSDDQDRDSYTVEP